MLFFFLNDPATTRIYPLSLHDALPISYRTQSRLDRVLEDACTAGPVPVEAPEKEPPNQEREQKNPDDRHHPRTAGEPPAPPSVGLFFPRCLELLVGRVAGCPPRRFAAQIGRASC